MLHQFMCTYTNKITIQHLSLTTIMMQQSILVLHHLVTIIVKLKISTCGNRFGIKKTTKSE